jgi:hypothetical protein
MNRIRNAETACLLILLVGVVVLISGCAGKLPKQTRLMEAAGGVVITSSELRMLTYEYSKFYASTVEEAAARIQAETDDPDVRYNALLWNAYSTPQMQRGAFQRDPYASLIDLRAFILQMTDYFTDGSGKELFGDQQDIALDTCRELHRTLMRVVRMTQPDRDSTAQDALYAEFVEANPIDSPMFTRVTTRPLLMDMTSVDIEGGLIGVAQMNETLAGLSDRMEIYTEVLPKQIRWHFQMMLDDYIGRQDAPHIARNVASISVSADRIAEFLDGTETLIAEERAILLDDLSRRLEEAYAVLEKERVAVTGDLSKERETVITDVSALAETAIGQSTESVNEIVDRVFAKATVLLAGFVVSLLIVGVILILLARALRRPVAPPAGA